MKVGLAGLGAMGAAIAARLIEVGHEVAVWNRSADKARPLVEAGATLATSPSDLAQRCDIVLSILTDGKAIDAVYNGPQGFLSDDVKGKLFIEMSTVPPGVPEATAGKVRAKGAGFVECPVGGSTVPARTGKLIGLMGAEKADADRARPLLDQLCRRVEHCGPVGSGASMKLAINLPLMVAWQAYGEAFAIASSLGWEPKRLLDLFADTSGANTALKGRAGMIVTMLEGRDPGPSTFTIDNGVKDLRTMVATGEARGIDMRATKAALSGFEDAAKAGEGGGDGSKMSVYWSQRHKKQQ